MSTREPAPRRLDYSPVFGWRPKLGLKGTKVYLQTKGIGYQLLSILVLTLSPLLGSQSRIPRAIRTPAHPLLPADATGHDAPISPHRGEVLLIPSPGLDAKPRKQPQCSQEKTTVREMVAAEMCIPTHQTFRKDKPDLTDSVTRVGERASAAIHAKATTAQGRGATVGVKKVKESMDAAVKQGSVGRRLQHVKHAGRGKLDCQSGGGGGGGGGCGAGGGSGSGGPCGGGGPAGGAGGGGGGRGAGGHDASGGSGRGASGSARASGGNGSGGSRIGNRNGIVRKVKLVRAQVDGAKQVQRVVHKTSDAVVQKKAQEREKQLTQTRNRYSVFGADV